MKAILQPCLWKVALLGRQEVMALPVTDYMIVAQSEAHGLVDMRVVIRRPNDDSERGERSENRAPRQ
jgi:hypothetical protein